MSINFSINQLDYIFFKIILILFNYFNQVHYQNCDLNIIFHHFLFILCFNFIKSFIIIIKFIDIICFFSFTIIMNIITHNFKIQMLYFSLKLLFLKFHFDFINLPISFLRIILNFNLKFLKIVINFFEENVSAFNLHYLIIID